MSGHLQELAIRPESRSQSGHYKSQLSNRKGRS